MTMTLLRGELPVCHSRFAITKRDWDHTPESVRHALETLWEENQQFREQLGQTSRNSSRAPSSDPPNAPPRPAKAPTGRTRGGQPGHAATHRPPLPPEQVTELVTVRPDTCPHCAVPFPDTAHDPTPQRHQVWEVPPFTATVTEYQLHTLTCPQCGTSTTGVLPAGVPMGGYGPRVTALVALLTGQYHLSKRAVADLLTTATGLPISEASVSRLEATMCDGLQAPYAAVRTAAQQAAQKWVDETGWHQQRDPDPDGLLTTPPLPKAWLWTVTTLQATVFAIRRSRAAKIVTELLGSCPTGIIHSDRHSAYHGLPLSQRQLCWAHLRRDFQKLIDRGGRATSVGTVLLADSDLLFTLWHRVRDGTLDRNTFAQQLAPVQDAFRAHLQEGALTADDRTVTFCRILQRLDPALWTFVAQEGAEPTNNRAERAIRTGVLWRHVSFGTQTSAGSRFVERILTAVATCRQQQRNVLTYLTAVAEAVYARSPAPSLL